MDGGVGDRDDAGLGGDGDFLIGGVEELAREGAASVMVSPRAYAGAPADVAAEVLGLRERALRAGRGHLQCVPLAHFRKVIGDTLAELERHAVRVIDEEADKVAPDDLGEQDLDFGLHL